MGDMKQRVVVLGASHKPERYSNRAVRRLMQHGHRVIPVNPSETAIEGLPVVSSLQDVDGPVDTLTVYVSPGTSTTLEETIIRLHPGRVIFNPGAENPALMDRLMREGIRTEEACTLALLATDQF